MLDWLSYQWSKRPMAVIVGAFILAIALDSVAAIWGERRPVGGFFEEFVARAFHWGIPFGAIGAGIFTGLKLSERTKSNALGWIVGILVFFVVGLGGSLLTSKIPGVGWRMERLMSDMD